MIINEILREADEEQLAALSQFLIGRADTKGVQSTMSVESFISLAKKMGVSIDFNTLMDMVEAGQLSGVIRDMNDDTIEFNSKMESEPKVSPNMGEIEKARNDMAVDTMAHRAMDKRE